MERAAVLIGVSKTGDLEPLQAVDSGLAEMRRWAQGQGITNENLVELTDANDREVTVNGVFQAIHQLVERNTVEQLLVYFAGHGVNRGYSEYWLLSGAPTNPNEAINVAGSIALAERVGIPHVVMISDACRTAPEGIAAQSVTGSEMFPNQAPAPGAAAASVDVFYACLLGEPANEFRRPDQSSQVFRSLYTEVLVECLSGLHQDAVASDDIGGRRVDVVRPYPLKRALPARVTKRIVDEDLWRTVNQTPDARVTSDPETAWLSRISSSRSGSSTERGRRPQTGTGPIGLSTLASGELRSALAGAPPAIVSEPLLPATDAGLDQLHRSTSSLAAEFGPAHFETGAGFKIRGERVVEAFSSRVGVEQLSDELVRIHGIDASQGSASVLFRFGSDSCTVLPAIEQYMGIVTLENGLLVDVSYEPMDTSPRWGQFEARAAEIRRVRAAVAASSRMGVLDLEEDTALALARHLQSLKGLDPALSIYAAYAYFDLRRRPLLEDMRDFLSGDINMVFFDIDLLLGRQPQFTPQDDWPPALPFFPLLARGWALMRAATGGRATRGGRSSKSAARPMEPVHATGL